MALALALLAPAGASGAVKTGIDRHGGMRLTLDGRVLTARILPGRHLGAQLYGKRIDAVCSSSFFHPRHARVIRRRLWPVGATRLSFTFGRDISRDAKWCLIEQDASDVASVSFVEPEPIRLSTEAVLYDRPRGSRVRARFFAAPQPAGGLVRSAQALDAAGVLIAERRVEDLSGEPCA